MSLSSSFPFLPTDPRLRVPSGALFTNPKPSTNKSPLTVIGGLLCLAFALLATACTPNLGGDNLGWAPVSASFSQTAGESSRVYVVSPMDGDLGDLGTLVGQDLGDDEHQVKVRALEDFGSGHRAVLKTVSVLAI